METAIQTDEQLREFIAGPPAQVDELSELRRQLQESQLRASAAEQERDMLKLQMGGATTDSPDGFPEVPNPMPSSTDPKNWKTFYCRGLETGKGNVVKLPWRRIQRCCDAGEATTRFFKHYNVADTSDYQIDCRTFEELPAEVQFKVGQTQQVAAQSTLGAAAAAPGQPAPSTPAPVPPSASTPVPAPAPQPGVTPNPAMVDPTSQIPPTPVAPTPVPAAPVGTAPVAPKPTGGITFTK